MKKLLICLEFGGRVLHEGRSDKLPLPVEIGRSPSCGWSVSGIDNSMSSHHAELFLKHRAIWIRDLGSRNGITCSGERIDKRRLRDGDKLHLGACMLTAEAVAEKSSEDILQYHRLEQLNGPRAGVFFDLLGTSDIIIGSDPSCGIACLDPLVSREHAVLSLKADGSCWARDLGSRNGTTVNGTVLSKDRERMLRDGDILSVAYIEFRFTDKNVVHPRAHLLWKTGIALATVAVALIGFYAYASVRPSARMLLRRAISFAESGNFDEAENVAKAAAGARGGDAYAPHRMEVLQNIAAWRKTNAAWLRMQKAIANRDWDKAQEESVHLSAWDWNSTSAPREGLRAERALALVRAFRAAQKALADGVGVAGLGAAEKELSAAEENLRMVADRAEDRAWSAGLFEDVAVIGPEVDKTIGELNEVDNSVKKLVPAEYGEVPAAANGVLAKLDAIFAENRSRKESIAPGAVFTPSRVVENRIGEFRAPLRALAVSECVFMSNVTAIASARFGDLSPHLPLPAAALAGISPAFPPYVERIREMNDLLCKTVANGWFSGMAELNKVELDAVKRVPPPIFKALYSTSVINRVLEFVPSPENRVIKIVDETPAAECPYDIFVGVYDFVDFLDSLDQDAAPGPAIAEYGKVGENWETAIEEIRRVSSVLRHFRDYGDHASGNVGRLTRLVLKAQVPDGENVIALSHGYARELLDSLEKWAGETFPNRCAAEGSERAAILAQGVRLLLAENPDRSAAVALARDWQTFKRSIRKGDGTEERAREIFREALPGMSEHKKAWEFLHREER